MLRQRRILRRLAILLFVLLFIPGCAGKPLLTPNDTYDITTITPQGITQTVPVRLSWNSNLAVLQNLLIEASFVMSDLHTQENPPLEPPLPTNTVMLEAHFPKSRNFNFSIDNRTVSLDLNSVEIEVVGTHPGRVILNHTLTLQGIPNPNLKPAFDEFIEMLQKSTTDLSIPTLKNSAQENPQNAESNKE